MKHLIRLTTDSDPFPALIKDRAGRWREAGVSGSARSYDYGAAAPNGNVFLNRPANDVWPSQEEEDLRPGKKRSYLYLRGVKQIEEWHKICEQNRRVREERLRKREEEERLRGKAIDCGWKA